MATEIRYFLPDGTELDKLAFFKSHKNRWQWVALGIDVPSFIRKNQDIWAAYPRAEASLPEKDRNWQFLRVVEFKTNGSAHKCDSRCLNAKGHKCECSCGGKNHGANA